MSELLMKNPLLDYVLNKASTKFNQKSVLNYSRDSPQILHSIQRIKVMEGHNSCVNTLAWNKEGDLLLSGSDDMRLNIYNYENGCSLAHSISSGHSHNIFNAKFMPNTNDSKIVSCSCDYSVMLTEVNLPSSYGKNKFNCHSSIPYDVVVLNEEPFSFFVCGRQGTVRHYDLRVKTSCNCNKCMDDVIIKTSSSINAMDICPSRPYEIAVGLGNNDVDFFDRRMIFLNDDHIISQRNDGHMFTFSQDFSTGFTGITSIRYNDEGTELLIHYVGDKLVIISCDPSDQLTISNLSFPPEYYSRTSYFDYNLLFRSDQLKTNICSDNRPQKTPQSRRSMISDYMRNFHSSPPIFSNPLKNSRIFEPLYKEVFSGHSNIKTMLKEASFWGDNYVMSGSDCGRIFVWDRKNGDVCSVWRGDEQVVNVIQPHPIYPFFACSGIDSTIKLFGPSKYSPTPQSAIQSAIADSRDAIDSEERLYQANFNSIPILHSLLNPQVGSPNETNEEIDAQQLSFTTEEEEESI